MFFVCNFQDYLFVCFFLFLKVDPESGFQTLNMQTHQLINHLNCQFRSIHFQINSDRNQSKRFFFSICFCSLKAFNLFLDDLGDSELEVAEFIKSSKNRAQLVDKLGYIYNKHQRNTDGTLIWWKCKEFQRNKTEIRCRARCTTKGFYITKKTNVIFNEKFSLLL